MMQPRRRAHQLILAACMLACATPLTMTTAQAAGYAWNLGWGSSDVQGSGAIKRQQRDIGHFTGVANGLSAKVEIHIGNTESVTVETDDNLLPLVETVVENGMLKIQTKGNVNLRTKNLKVIVQAKSVDHISLGGSGTITSDPLRARSMQVDLGGSGNIDLQSIDTDSMQINLGGSGDLKAGSGRAKSMSISIGGSGDIKLGRVRSDTVNVNIAGSGEATVWVKDALSLNVAGSGDVNYYGDPHITTQIFGSGGTHRLGAAPQ